MLSNLNLNENLANKEIEKEINQLKFTDSFIEEIAIGSARLSYLSTKILLSST